MKDCIFCKIMNGEIPSYTIYEDELVKVFLDISPSTNGDALVVPKKHFVTIEEVEDDLLMHLHQVIKDMKLLLERTLHCDGLTIVQNNGHGQDIKHFHIHLTPRYLDDNLRHEFNKEKLIDITKIYEQIKQN